MLTGVNVINTPPNMQIIKLQLFTNNGNPIAASSDAAATVYFDFITNKNLTINKAYF
jgi:hypothetical protein